ncbi:MAG TPA: hypothetical protein VM450_06835 [Thermomicrobiales bacterium]|nr:hypothetical protein [Thermomicrobiales bacterium]
MSDAGIDYCILHGYQRFDDGIDSDVDCIVGAQHLPEGLVLAVQSAGLRVVQHLQHESTAHYFVITDDGRNGPSRFLKLDVSSDYRRDGRVFYSGDEMLADRQPFEDYWVPQPAQEFGYYLVKKTAKGSISDDQARRLSELHAADPAGCDAAIDRFWSREYAALLKAAARTGSWESVRTLLPQFRQDLLRTTGSESSSRPFRYWLADVARRCRRIAQPTGLHVVFLGPDGAGKSTVIEQVEQALAPAFRRTTIQHLAPGVLRRRTSSGPVVDPHQKPARSLPQSLMKGAYWLVDYALGYHLKVRPNLVRSTLVLFDRYLPDVLVDPRRYRYGGPAWLVSLVWRVVPKPDLVILLDAPTEVLQARKREVPPEETARQREAYRALVTRLPNGHIVDANQPIEQVVSDVNEIIVCHLAARTARRLGVGTPS